MAIHDGVKLVTFNRRRPSHHVHLIAAKSSARLRHTRPVNVLLFLLVLPLDGHSISHSRVAEQLRNLLRQNFFLGHVGHSRGLAIVRWLSEYIVSLVDVLFPQF